MKRLIFLILIILNVSAVIIFSQSFCPEDYTNWDKGYSDYDLGQYGSMTSSEFFYRSNGNFSYDIVMDWSTFVNENDFISNSALRKIFEMEAIYNVVPDIQGPYNCTVNVYYETDCSVTSNVYINLDRDFTIACCDDGINVTDDIIDFLENGVHYKVIKWSRSQYCGKKCCKRVYSCQRYFDGATWRTKVNSPTFVSVTNCDGSSNYIDCKSGEPIPCTGDCNHW